MLETIINFLLSLALGAAGTAGLAVAAEASADSRADAAPISLDEELAAIQARVEQARANADDEADLDVELAFEHGLTTAADAIEAAMDLAPEAADTGLTIALDAVTSAPIGGAPEGTPSGAPEGTPSGPPEGTPSGRP